MTALIKNLTSNPKIDILSGFTVALALVPEAVAFAFVAGLDPLVGLYGDKNHRADLRRAPGVLSG